MHSGSLTLIYRARGLPDLVDVDDDDDDDNDAEDVEEDAIDIEDVEDEELTDAVVGDFITGEPVAVDEDEEDDWV